MSEELEPAVAVETTEVVPEPETPLVETKVEAIPTPEGEEPSEPETYDAYIERINTREDWKTAHEARLDELRTEATKQGRREAQSRLQPMVQQRRDDARTAAQTLINIEQVFAKAAQDGTLDADTVNQAWHQHRQYTHALVNMAGDVGTVTGGKSFIAFALGGQMDKNPDGNPVWKVPQDTLSIAEKYMAEMDGVLQGQSTPNEVAQDFIEELMEARITKAKAPLQARIKSLEAQLEKGKAGTRENQGVKTTGSTGGGMNKQEIYRAHAAGEISSTEAERRLKGSI